MLKLSNSTCLKLFAAPRVEHQASQDAVRVLDVQLSAKEGATLIQAVLSTKPRIQRCSFHIPGWPACKPPSSHSRGRKATGPTHLHKAAGPTHLQISQPLQPGVSRAPGYRVQLPLHRSEIGTAFGPLPVSDGADAEGAPRDAAALVLQKHLDGCASLVVVKKLPQLHVPFWEGVVAPGVGCSSMRVESWLHGPSRLADACSAAGCVVNAAGVRLADQSWTVMQDHAKWAVCCVNRTVCFGDMNREEFQQFRGGMGLCLSVALDTEGACPAAALIDELRSLLIGQRTKCAACGCEYPC